MHAVFGAVDDTRRNNDCAFGDRGHLPFKKPDWQYKPIGNWSISCRCVDGRGKESCSPTLCAKDAQRIDGIRTKASTMVE